MEKKLCFAKNVQMGDLIFRAAPGLVWLVFNKLKHTSKALHVLAGILTFLLRTFPHQVHFLNLTIPQHVSEALQFEVSLNI